MGHTCSDSGGDAVLGTGLTMRCNNHGLSVVITAVIDFIVIGRQVQIHPLTPPPPVRCSLYVTVSARGLKSNLIIPVINEKCNEMKLNVM